MGLILACQVSNRGIIHLLPSPYRARVLRPDLLLRLTACRNLAFPTSMFPEAHTSSHRCLDLLRSHLPNLQVATITSTISASAPHFTDICLIPSRGPPARFDQLSTNS